jgi:hypothetical protein
MSVGGNRCEEEGKIEVERECKEEIIGMEM